MPAIWKTISSTASSEPVFTGGGRTRGLTIVRRADARGLRLSVDPRDGAVRLTLGARTPLRSALRWATEKRVWVEGQLARLPQSVAIAPGMVIDLDGRPVVLAWNAGWPRKAVLSDHELALGGPLATLPARVLRALRDQALEILTEETRALAGAHGIAVARVGVGDPRARWGSCSGTGDIRYSWRLILAPRFVRQATVAHEVAHRVHMNHGPAFHALVAELHGSDPDPARAWLRAHGTALHWFGRGG